jgi:hypothetical protein
MPIAVTGVPGDVAEHTRMGVVAAIAEDLGIELVEEGFEGGAVPGERLVEEGAEVRGRGRDDDGAVAEAGVVGGDSLDGGCSQPADFVRRKGEGILEHAEGSG